MGPTSNIWRRFSRRRVAGDTSSRFICDTAPVPCTCPISSIAKREEERQRPAFRKSLVKSRHCQHLGVNFPHSSTFNSARALQKNRKWRATETGTGTRTRTATDHATASGSSLRTARASRRGGILLCAPLPSVWFFSRVCVGSNGLSEVSQCVRGCSLRDACGVAGE